MSIDYFSLWKRNDDPALISTFADPALRAKLAADATAGVAEPGLEVMFSRGIPDAAAWRRAGERMR